MTAGQAALADGFAVTLAVHGQTWVRASDSASFSGVATKNIKIAPHMAEAQDRNFPILVADSVLSPTIPTAQCMPEGTSRLKVGDNLTKNVGSVPKYYTVARADYDEDTGLWTVFLSATF